MTNNNVIRRVVSVSRLNAYLKGLVDDDVILADLRVKGMVTNVKAQPHSASGHIYFSLKDEKASIQCVMFKNFASRLDVALENGAEVVCFGRVGIYEKTGGCQFYAESAELAGIAAEKTAFDLLRDRLEKEGIFAAENKKPVPTDAARVAVVTSAQGAAVRDIISVVSRRSPATDIILSQTSVQGEGAAREIARAIQIADAFARADVIIVGRGGGAEEDLAAFNDEMTVRAVFECKTPVISAVGHETDVTLTDFAADLRAPTPSAAAELAVRGAKERSLELADVWARIERDAAQKLQESAYKTQRLLNAINGDITQKLSKLDTRTRSATARLKDLSPLNVLSRGFSYVTRGDTHVNSVKNLSENDVIAVHLRDGDVGAKIVWRSLGEKDNG